MKFGLWAVAIGAGVAGITLSLWSSGYLNPTGFAIGVVILVLMYFANLSSQKSAKGLPAPVPQAEEKGTPNTKFKFCNYCGAQNPRDARYCSTCGRAVQPEHL